MRFYHQPIIAWPYAVEDCLCAREDPGAWTISEPAARIPEHPERTDFYQLFETHFDSYVRAYEERFESRSGPLRPAVVRSVEEFLACGRLQGGFARLRCPKCHAEHLLAFSCRTRNFCSKVVRPSAPCSLPKNSLGKSSLPLRTVTVAVSR